MTIMGLKLTQCKRDGCNDQFHYCTSCDFNEIHSLGYCHGRCMRKDKIEKEEEDSDD